MELRLGLVGVGRVGSALLEHLARRGPALARRSGIRLNLVAAADRRGSALAPEGGSLSPRRLLEARRATGRVDGLEGAGRPGLSAESLIEAAEEVDVWVECTPTELSTGEPGLGHVRRALARGRGVVLANKGPLVAAYRELVATARSQGVPLRYAAAVTASLPLLALAGEALAGDRLIRLEATLSSTANWILHRMGEGMPYAVALEEAQAQGLAETDPALDVEGWDSAAKGVVLGRSLGLSIPGLLHARVVGLTHVDAAAVRREARAGGAVRLVTRVSPAGVEVAPRLLAPGDPLLTPHPLAKAAVLELEQAGTVRLQGGRAGPAATAASLVADLLAVGAFLQAARLPVEHGRHRQPIQDGAGV